VSCISYFCRMHFRLISQRYLVACSTITGKQCIYSYRTPISSLDGSLFHLQQRDWLSSGLHCNGIFYKISYKISKEFENSVKKLMETQKKLMDGIKKLSSLLKASAEKQRLFLVESASIFKRFIWYFKRIHVHRMLKMDGQ